ncbi:response regulator [uncultured Methanospirillum sp.]|uniref:ATP-binding response regulator n=1 Tax=uncultured Methanospirillum sp. TaxID=262503 RepID=UPI0029C8339E|nr:response regulator [uncultured Methanospirillum sp.]
MPIRVLHIDDNAMILEISRLYLAKLGYFEITTEINPKIAAEMDLSRFDAIVSDYEMPEMDGLQLLDAVRSKGVQIPFILLTGRGNDTVMIRALSAGAASYLHKTANPRAMFTELAAVLHKEMELKSRAVSVYHPSPVQRDNHLFDHLPEPAFAVNNEGSVTAWNQAAVQMTGRSADTMIGVGWEQCSLAFGGEQRKMAVHALLSGDVSSLDGYEITLSSSTLIIGKRTSRTEEGVLKTYWEKSSLIIGTDGRADGAVVIIRDLTMRRSIINQNKVMREQLAAIADCMIEFGGSFKTNIRSVLTTACRFCGAAMAGYVSSGNTRPDCVCIYCCDEHKDDKQEFRSCITGDIHERRDQTAPRWYTREYSVGSEGSSRVILAFFEDEESSFCDSFIRLLIGAISAEEQRHTAIEEKNQSEERYRMIFENAPVALFEEDYSGVYRRLMSDDDCVAFSHSWDDPAAINSLMNEVHLTSMNEASCRLSQREDL